MCCVQLYTVHLYNFRRCTPCVDWILLWFAIWTQCSTVNVDIIFLFFMNKQHIVVQIPTGNFKKEIEIEIQRKMIESKRKGDCKWSSEIFTIFWLTDFLWRGHCWSVILSTSNASVYLRINFFFCLYFFDEFPRKSLRFECDWLIFDDKIVRQRLHTFVGNKQLMNAHHSLRFFSLRSLDVWWHISHHIAKRYNSMINK